MTSRWVYLSENFAGNAHETVKTINDTNHWHGWEMVGIQFNGGGYTTVVFKKRVKKA